MTAKLIVCSFGFLCIFLGCSFEPIDSTAKILDPSIHGAEAATKPNLSPADVACQKDYECMVINMGCCPNEETSALNRNKVLAVKHSVNRFCSPLRLANQNLCKGKKSSIFGPKAECVAQKCVVIK